MCEAVDSSIMPRCMPSVMRSWRFTDTIQPAGHSEEVVAGALAAPQSEITGVCGLPDREHDRAIATPVLVAQCSQCNQCWQVHELLIRFQH